MTITTRSIPKREARARAAAAFTLVELIVAMTLSSIVMAGVISTYLYIARVGYRTSDYSEMEAQSRLGLEVFARDVRSANGIVWNSSTRIAMTIPTSTADTVTYEYELNSDAGTFTRTCTSAGTPTQTLISGIEATSAGLRGYKLTIDPVTKYPCAVDMTNLTQASVDTKQLQLTLHLTRVHTTLARTTGNVISARFILRNKRVTT